MAPHIRRATNDDAEILSALLADYLRESYPDHRGSTPAQLRRDVLIEPQRHHVLVVEIRRQMAGFVAWDRVYDMHWASSGAQVADLYVAPEYRGLGVALMLIAQMAVDVLAHGGVFLRGGAYDRASTRRLYARAAVVLPSGETYLAGRALRHLAQFAGRPARDIVRNLPPVAWNYDA
ncbi:MAG TPA: GNAT family N-acetyltransferase [Gemmatimonadaceae bacterium]|nr:GNAT family N-acetyltransferase [Gemmatimonadaceae bacterium]